MRRFSEESHSHTVAHYTYSIIQRGRFFCQTAMAIRWCSLEYYQNATLEFPHFSMLLLWDEQGVILPRSSRNRKVSAKWAQSERKVSATERKLSTYVLNLRSFCALLRSYMCSVALCCALSKTSLFFVNSANWAILIVALLYPFAQTSLFIWVFRF